MLVQVSVVAEMFPTNTLSCRPGWPVLTQSTQLLFLQVPLTVRSALSQARLIGLNAT